MKKTIFTLLAVAAVFGSTTALAKTSLGTVKTPSGAEVPKVGVQGTVTSVSETGKNQVTVKESDGKTYNVNLGPRWYANTQVKEGDNISVEGLEKNAGTVSAWKLTKADGSEVTIRTQAGKPSWAGKGGNRQHRGQGQGAGFVDENKDGICDRMQ